MSILRRLIAAIIGAWRRAPSARARNGGRPRKHQTPAERTAAWRKRKMCDETSFVTVTKPVTKPLSPSLTLPPSIPTHTNPGARSRARIPLRLEENWQPSAEAWQFAADLLTAALAGEQLARFRDYWAAEGGPKAVKLDWNAAWRNWVRRYADDLTSGQQRLPMLRTVKSGKASPVAATTPATVEGKIYIAPLTHEAQWEAWRKHRGGKSLPTDKAGGWWVDSEWPAGSDVEAKRRNG